MGRRRHRSSIRHGNFVSYWRSLGPGLITGASDNDPSGITTYTVAGAVGRYRLLWMAVVTMPLLVAVQSMAARIGAVKEEGLGKVIEDRYHRRVLEAAIVVLLVANTATIAADFAGIAAGVHLLVPIPEKIVIPIVGLVLLAVETLWTYHRFAAVIKWLTLVLLLYVLSGFLAHPAWREVVNGTLVPRLSWDHDTIASAVAILGTTISPYMFFWIASQEVEEEEESAPGPERTATSERARRRDVITGMAYANVVFYFIVLSSAATLGAKGIKVETAGQAAQALEPIVGRLDSVVFAVGLIGAGMIAIPVLAGSSAYPMAELFGWREGLGNTVRHAPGFYAVLSASVVLGVAGNFLGIDPVQGLVYAAILQGILAPILLVLLTSVARDPTVMGEHRNGWFDTVFGYATAAIMAIASLTLLAVSVF